MFLGGALSISWIAVLVALQKADYFLTTRDTAPPGSAALGPNTGATSSTPSKHGGMLAEGLAGGDNCNNSSDRGNGRHIHFWQTSTRSVQAAIWRLFDASVILKDSTFR